MFVSLFLCLSISAQDSTAVKKSTVFIDVHAGPGMRLGKQAPPDNNSYYGNYSGDVRNGFQLDVSLYLEVVPRHSMSLKYNKWNKSFGIRGVNEGMTDDITLSFYGIGYMFTNQEMAHSMWSVEGSLGYMTYKDQMKVGTNEIKVTGNTIGVFLGGAYYFKLFKGVYLGPKLSLLVGGISKFNTDEPGMTQIETEQPESMSRLDISLGLRFKL